jgi:single-strand DNA-binding protein
MASVNQVTLVGRLGKDPELKQLDGGKVVAKFTVATSFGTGENEHTDWHNVVAWEKTAENAAKYLKKGSLVYVSGRITTRSWEDKDGVRRYMTEVVANTALSLSPKSSTLEQPTAAPAAAKTEDQIPF